MKTILTFILLTFSTITFAQHHGNYRHNHNYRHHHHGHWRHYDGHWQWVVPTIIAGAVVYSVVKSQERPQEIVVVERQVIQSNCSAWTEIENDDGTVTRTRTCKK